MGELQGTGNPETQGEAKKGKREGRERQGGPEPPSDGKDSKLNIRDRV